MGRKKGRGTDLGHGLLEVVKGGVGGGKEGGELTNEKRGGGGKEGEDKMFIRGSNDELFASKEGVMDIE